MHPSSLSPSCLQEGHSSLSPSHLREGLGVGLPSRTCSFTHPFPRARGEQQA